MIGELMSLEDPQTKNLQSTELREKECFHVSPLGRDKSFKQNLASGSKRRLKDWLKTSQSASKCEIPLNP